MGHLFKGLAMGGIAAAKAILPGGESPGEAFKRVFEDYTKNNSANTDVISGTEIEKVAVQDVKGDVTETTYKTSNLANSSTTGGQTVVYNDNSNKQVSNQNMSKNETYTGSLNKGMDPYFDRASYNGA